MYTNIKENSWVLSCMHGHTLNVEVINRIRITWQGFGYEICTKHPFWDTIVPKNMLGKGSENRIKMKNNVKFLCIL